jgi:hypothetical protein
MDFYLIITNGYRDWARLAHTLLQGGAGFTEFIEDFNLVLGNQR